MIEKECLINSLVIRLADSCHMSAKELKEIITEEMASYTVQRMETTLPSTGDGSATRFLMEKFIQGKAAEGLTQKSLEQYVLAVRQLIEFSKKELNMITSDDVKEYLIYLKNVRKNSSVTVKGRFLFLSSVFSYLFNHHYIADNPVLNIATPKADINLKKPLSEREVELIRIACESFENRTRKLRDIALFNFMLDTGVRVSEVSKINMDDIDWNDGSCIVHGKGGKDREVVFRESTAIRLKEYIMCRKDINSTINGYTYSIQTPLFLNRTSGRMSKDSIEKEMRVLAEISGVSRLHPHLIRATFATNLAVKGVSIQIIADLLGHANLHTINRYILLPKSKMKDIVRAA